MKLPAPLLVPWAITEPALREVAHIATKIDPAALLANSPKALEEPEERQLNVRDGVAIIPISGPMVREGGLLAMLFGISSYESIRKDFECALNSEEVTAIAFDIDSPGGEVHGAGELSAAIYAARGRKPITSYVSGMCASAAYWIGSAADSITVDPSAIVGSIGVRTMLTDDSKRDEQQGIKEYNIVSSQSPYKVIDAASSADRQRVQDGLTAMAEVFIADVARNRGISEEEVKKEYGKGDVFVGQHAIAAGMVDGLGDFESLLSSIQGEKMNPKDKEAVKSAKLMHQSSAKCDACASDMDDDDDMYCSACYNKGDADAKASFGPIVALVGAKDIKQAIGIVTALKAQAEQVEKLSAELAEIKKEKAAHEVTALIEAAVGERRVTKDGREKMLKLAADHGVEALRACLDAMPKGVAPAVEPTIKPGAVVSHPSEIEKMLRATGNTVEGLAAHKAKLRSTVNPGEEA